MSKSVGKRQCRYKFIRGPKKGKPCKKSCRGEFCKDHNPRKLAYQEKYYADKKIQKSSHKIDQLIEQVKTCKDESELPNIDHWASHFQKVKAELLWLYRMRFGVRQALGCNDSKLINKFSKYLNHITLWEELTDDDRKLFNDENDYYRYVETMGELKSPTIPYKGSEASAKKKIKEIEKKRDKLIDKFNSLKKLIKAIEKKKQEFEEN